MKFHLSVLPNSFSNFNITSTSCCYFNPRMQQITLLEVSGSELFAFLQFNRNRTRSNISLGVLLKWHESPGLLHWKGDSEWQWSRVPVSDLVGLIFLYDGVHARVFPWLTVFPISFCCCIFRIHFSLVVLLYECSKLKLKVARAVRLAKLCHSVSSTL